MGGRREHPGPGNPNLLVFTLLCSPALYYDCQLQKIQALVQDLKTWGKEPLFGWAWISKPPLSHLH